MIIYDFYRVLEEKELFICGGIKEYELVYEVLVGFLINGCGERSIFGDGNYMDKIIEVWIFKDDLGNSEGFD